MHIAFSGRLGSGKSTVCRILKDKYGFEIYSTGSVQRAVAEKMGISTLELNKLMANDPKLDFEIDNAVTAISKEKDRILFDSRMAWHFAVNAFKVYMYVDPNVAAKRVCGDDRGSVEKYGSVGEARDLLISRTKEENARYKKIYGVDNLDFRNYDLIIDSTSATPDEIAETIYREYLSACEGKKSFKVFISPLSVAPADVKDDGENAKVRVTGDGFMLVSGYAAYKKALDGKESFIEVTLDCEE
ncbi:MAG: cytidylate kinase family protein [Clostridia bacterium]|nr:cytidylate kinase family protein [Clostridia bacterium]